MCNNFQLWLKIVLLYKLMEYTFSWLEVKQSVIPLLVRKYTSYYYVHIAAIICLQTNFRIHVVRILFHSDLSHHKENMQYWQRFRFFFFTKCTATTVNVPMHLRIIDVCIIFVYVHIFTPARSEQRVILNYGNDGVQRILVIYTNKKKRTRVCHVLSLLLV